MAQEQARGRFRFGCEVQALGAILKRRPFAWFPPIYASVTITIREASVGTRPPQPTDEKRPPRRGTFFHRRADPCAYLH